jgi:TIR domain
MAGNIFINYRREESGHAAGRLHEWLGQAFGPDKLFMDVDNLPAGFDFADHLTKQVAACDAMLAVIGPNWLDAKDERGDRRLDDPDDFVAIEIGAALARDIPVIPVLVDGAHMPRASELPDSLKPLARRQALEVRHTNFRRDAEALIARVREALGLGLLPSPEIKRSGAGAGLAKWVAAAAALFFIAGGAGFWAYSEHQRNKAELAREGRFEAGTLAAGEARRGADAERQAPISAAPPATFEPPRTPPAAPNTAGAGTNGLYGGQICYGPSQGDPARCYRAQAIVQQGKVSGQWPGRDPGITMHLAGDVSPSGDVTIHMHAERGDGSRPAIADLVGTLRDGRLDAAGSFTNGRSVSLNWRRN